MFQEKKRISTSAEGLFSAIQWIEQNIRYKKGEICQFRLIYDKYKKDLTAKKLVGDANSVAEAELITVSHFAVLLKTYNYIRDRKKVGTFEKKSQVFYENIEFCPLSNIEPNREPNSEVEPPPFPVQFHEIQDSLDEIPVVSVGGFPKVVSEEVLKN